VTNPLLARGWRVLRAGAQQGAARRQEAQTRTHPRPQPLMRHATHPLLAACAAACGRGATCPPLPARGPHSTLKCAHHRPRLLVTRQAAATAADAAPHALQPACAPGCKCRVGMARPVAVLAHQACWLRERMTPQQVPMRQYTHQLPQVHTGTAAGQRVHNLALPPTRLT